MAKIETQYVLVGRDQTKRAMSSFQRNVSRAQKAVFSLRGALVSLGAAAAVRDIASAGLAIERIEQGLKFATGSAAAAASELAFVRKEAERIGINFEVAASSFTRLAAAAKGTAVEGRTAREIFVGLSEASRVLGLSADQTQGALVAIEQIISKGKVSAEELRGQLGERLFGAFQIAARSIGVTTEELDEFLKQGKLTATELLPALARELRTTFGPEVADASQTAAASFERFNNAVFALKVTLAEGGLLDSLAAMADKLTAIANASTVVGELFAGGLGFGAAADQLEKQINRLEAERAGILRRLEGLARPGAQDDGLLGALVRKLRDDPGVDELRNRLNDLNEEIERLKDLQLEVGFPGGLPGADDAAEDLNTIKDLLEEIQVVAKTPISLAEFADEFLPTLTIETQLDRDLEAAGLRESNADVKELQRSFSLLDDEVKKTNQTAIDLGFTFASAFEEAIISGNGLRDVLKGLLDDIIRIIARMTVTQPLSNALTGLFSSGFGSLFGAAPAATTSSGGAGIILPWRGFKASGGPVYPGGAYTVGEEGPELFVPRVAGSIVPNGAGVGAVTIQTTINVDSRADREQLRAELGPIVSQSVEASVGRVRQLSRRGKLL